MNRNYLYILWGSLFALCAGLGFVPEPAGVLRGLLTALSLVFFLPPAWLLYDGAKQQDRTVLLLVRNLSALSLGLTLGLLILNFLTAFRSELLGAVFHGLLTVISAPMVCSGHWALSLFLWACLLMGSRKELKKTASARKGAS